MLRFIVFALGAATCVVHAQPAAAPQLRFDVASVRPNRKDECRGRWDFRVSHGTLNAENAPLLRIVSRAYNLTDDRVSGPVWIESQCYDIVAKAPNNTPDRDVMPMLQALLKERFHMAARRESDERPILALVVDKGGARLRPFGDKITPPPSIAEGSVLFMVRRLPDLCERLGKVAGRPVIDKTGLTGDYQIELRYVPSGSALGEPSDLVSAVREQLGLRLNPERGTVDVLKIDSIDKVPTKN